MEVEFHLIIAVVWTPITIFLNKVFLVWRGEMWEVNPLIAIAHNSNPVMPPRGHHILFTTITNAKATITSSYKLSCSKAFLLSVILPILFIANIGPL
jgi:hypothetical protein